MKKTWINIATAILLMAGTVEAEAANRVETGVNTEAENAVTPYMRTDGERVYVNYLNLDGDSVVVKVVDSENRVLYYERFSASPVVEKAINFSKAVKGVYKVEVLVSDGDRTYSESLKVVR